MTKAEITRRHKSLSGWSVDDNVLKKEFKFKDFAAAMEFMNALATVAERLNHHPDWSNSYNKVIICLSTHSEGGLTAKDFELAAATDKIAS